MNNNKIKPGDVYSHKATGNKRVVIKVLNAMELLVRTKEDYLEIYKLFELVREDSTGSRVIEEGFG